MAQNSQLSNALRITDINDFLSPSAACVLPLGGGALPETNEKPVVKFKKEPAGSVLAPIVPTNSTVSGNARAKVTVSDCLSCSGCVTSADTVLLSTESIDSLKSFMRNRDAKHSDFFAIAGLSQQAVASIAVHNGLSLTSTARKLTTFLKEQIGFDVVIDLSFPRHIALLEAKEEFLKRYREGKKLTITSACPGWVTYAEKTQGGSILEYISKVRSPQGVFGAVAEHLRPAKDHRPVWVSTIMMCHDKKLEANRPELVRTSLNDEKKKELDCVITTGELATLMQDHEFDIRSAAETPLESEYAASISSSFGVEVGSGSGGFAEFILREAAREVLGITLPNGPQITEKASKSGDLKTRTVWNERGDESLTFATAYGFRCLQSILRKIRRGECTYNYIELMACPGGCNNGGGQLPLAETPEGDSRSLKRRATEHLQRVEKAFHDSPQVGNALDVPSVKKLYKDSLGGHPGAEEARAKLEMPILQRKTTGMSALSW